MAHFSLGFGSKISALLIGSVFLTGCYQIEMKETLNLDGTSELALKLDMSGMANAMNGLAMNMEAMETAEEIPPEPVEKTGPTYESCSDPDLIARYNAESLEGPETIITDLTVEEVTTCAPSQQEGFVTVTTEHIDTETEMVLFDQVVERRADSCNAAALLAFYQIEDFSTPIVEEYPLEKTVEISCSDIRDDIAVTTLTTYEGEAPGEPIIETFTRPTPEVIPDNTLAELEALTLSAEEIEAKEQAESLKVCDETEQNPETLPFFFSECENTEPGVGVFYYTKYDTTGFKINANGTVTYNLEPSTNSFNETVSEGLDQSSEDPMTAEMNPSMFGMSVDYVLVSPWPIIEHSVGQLEDEYTLRVDLLAMDQAEGFSVTLDTDGASLDLISPRTQQQIDQLIDRLEEQLVSSEAPVERQVEYIYHLSGKIQQLAAIKPSQQVALGYLQTKLINLTDTLESNSIAELEADFLAELEQLETEAFAEEEEILAEADATADMAEENSLEGESEMIEMEAEVEAETEASIEEETASLEESLRQVDQTPAENPEPPLIIEEEEATIIEEEVFEEEEMFEEEEDL